MGWLIYVLAACGAIFLLWAVREVALGLKDGWNKGGMPFWTEVRERAAEKRRR